MNKKPKKMFYCSKRKALIGLFDIDKQTVEVVLKCSNQKDLDGNQYCSKSLIKAAKAYNDSLEKTK